MTDRALALAEYPPRGLSRDEAARYVGIGTTLFDELVQAGRMPKPLDDGRRLRWSKEQIDSAFSALATTGMIYVIQAMAESPVKIGFTQHDDAAARVATLQTGNPYRLRILVTAQGTISQERAAHRALASDRLVGEWFAWSPRVALFVAAMPHGISAALEAVNG